MNISKIRKCITIKLCTLWYKTILCQPLIDHSSISMSAIQLKILKIQLKILTFPNRPAYRLICITHKILYINFPKYLLESLSLPEITNIKLRTTIDNFILQARVSHSCHQLRSFTCSAPIIWNKLPLHIRSTSNHNLF